jgi:hypothetical protein
MNKVRLWLAVSVLGASSVSGAQAPTEPSEPPREVMPTPQSACGISGNNLKEIMDAVKAIPSIQVDPYRKPPVLRDSAKGNSWIFGAGLMPTYAAAVCLHFTTKDGKQDVRVEVACFGDVKPCRDTTMNWQADAKRMSGQF